MHLKEWRADDGRSQAAIGELIGCSQSTIDRIENRKQDASAEQIRRLVKLSDGAITADAMLEPNVGDSV